MPLWFNPAAWAGLAAAWIMIFALQSASHGNAPKVVTASAAQPSTFLMSLTQERQTLAELMGNNQPDDTDKPRHAHPQPRSELHTRFAIA